MSEPFELEKRDDGSVVVLFRGERYTLTPKGEGRAFEPAVDEERGVCISLFLAKTQEREMLLGKPYAWVRQWELDAYCWDPGCSVEEAHASAEQFELGVWDDREFLPVILEEQTNIPDDVRALIARYRQG